MKVITILFLIYIFFKTWYYGIYELKSNKNKPAAIAIFFMAIVRANISYYYNVCFLLVSTVFILDFLFITNSIIIVIDITIAPTIT